MISRKYSKRVQIWKTVASSDGFGGLTIDPLNDVDLGGSWAYIKTIRPEKLIALGITDYTYAIEVKLRYRYDLDYEQEGIYFKYDGNTFIFNTVLPVDYERAEVTVIAVKL